MTLSPAEQREHKRISRTNSRLRKQGVDVPYVRQKNRWSSVARCPICGEVISAQKDCRCP